MDETHRKQLVLVKYAQAAVFVAILGAGGLWAKTVWSEYQSPKLGTKHVSATAVEETPQVDLTEQTSDESVLETSQTTPSTMQEATPVTVNEPKTPVVAVAPTTSISEQIENGVGSELESEANLEAAREQTKQFLTALSDARGRLRIGSINWPASQTGPSAAEPPSTEPVEVTVPTPPVTPPTPSLDEALDAVRKLKFDLEAHLVSSLDDAPNETRPTAVEQPATETTSVSNTVEEPEVDQLGPGIVRLVNTTDYPFAFVWKQTTQDLQPKQHTDLKLGSTPNQDVRFHRGGSFGETTVSCKAGIYEFSVSADGWTLTRQTEN